MNPKTKIYFGPPLVILTEPYSNTLEISGKINRTAERYLEIMSDHGITLSDSERACLSYICDFGHMSPDEIRELPFEVLETDFEAEDLIKNELSEKLRAASFADLVALVERLGF